MVEASKSAAVIIERARATVGSPEALDNVVTLRMVGSLESANRAMPDAGIVILARKPDSQRLEIRVDDLVETIIMDGRSGCMVRSNVSVGASQMRRLSGTEIDRIRYATRQLFKFYRPDLDRGETVTYRGVKGLRGRQVHRLVYRYPDGYKTIRYFCVEDDELVGYKSENGVESYHVGEKVVDGIRYPERIEYFVGEMKLHFIVFKEIEVNHPLPKGIFRIPKGQEN